MILTSWQKDIKLPKLWAEDLHQFWVKNSKIRLKTAADLHQEFNWAEAWKALIIQRLIQLTELYQVVMVYNINLIEELVRKT